MAKILFNSKIPLSFMFFITVFFWLCLFLGDGGIRYSATNLFRLYQTIANGGLFDLRIGMVEQGEKIVIKRDDGLALAGSVYGLKGDRNRPGILLLHGRTSKGRNLPVYRVLAGRLAQRGYLVLTIDFAGFGESDDPFLGEGEGCFDFPGDANAALDYMETICNLDLTQISVIGHSLGSAAAFSVGVRDQRVKRVVVLGPTRRVAQRIQDPFDRDMQWRTLERARMVTYGKRFPPWYSKEVWAKWRMDEDMRKYVGYFSQEGHKPLLLMDGEFEAEKDKEYLWEYYSMITEPKKYVTIQRSDHYCSIGELGGVIFYDQAVIGRTVSEIDQWLRK